MTQEQMKTKINSYQEYEKYLESIDKISMSELADRSYKIYRSQDSQLTGIYFAKMRDSKKPLYHEIIKFDWDRRSPFFLIKYPHHDFYIELLGGVNSSNGVMEKANLRNVIREEAFPNTSYADKSKIRPEGHDFYSFGKSAMIEYPISHDFLEDVTSDETIMEASSRKYIPLPDSRTIAYAYRTQDGKILIVDQSEYNFKQETMRCFFGDFTKGIHECKIHNYARYRDGGTTTFDIEYNGEKLDFYFPTPFREEDEATINKLPMAKLDEGTLSMVVLGLGIRLAPKIEC